MTAPSSQPTPPIAPTAAAGGDYQDGPRGRMTRPAQSSSREPGNQLTPSASAPGARGARGIAHEFSDAPVLHRDEPAAQRPTPSDRWFPRVAE